jgi:hypothetical protein
VADKQSEDGQNAPAQGPATPATANHSDPRQEEWGTADAVIRPSDPEAAYLRTISTPASAPDWAESSSAPASSRTRKTKPASEATAPESAQQSATHMDNSTQATTQHDQADKNAVSSSSNEIPQAIPPQTEVKKTTHPRCRGGGTAVNTAQSPAIAQGNAVQGTDTVGSNLAHTGQD